MGCCQVSFVAWTRSPLLCAGGWPETIHAPFHMCASEAPRSSKSTHMEGPEQLQPPSLILLRRVPCVFVSVPFHMVSSATSTIIWWWLWLELSRAMPATIPPLFPLKGVCFFLFGPAHLVIFVKDSPAVGCLVGHWAWEPGAAGTVLLLTPHLPCWMSLYAFRPHVTTQFL